MQFHNLQLKLSAYSSYVKKSQQTQDSYNNTDSDIVCWYSSSFFVL